MMVQPSRVLRALRVIGDTRAGRLGAILACLCLLAAELYRAVRPQPFMPVGAHFSLYYQAALAVRHGADPYTPAMTWILRHAPASSVKAWYIYPPLFALLLAPLTVLPVHAAYVLWGTCNVAFLVGAIYALLRAAGARPSLLSVLALAAAAGLTRSVWYELLLGQVNLFVLVCLCAALWARFERGPGVAGLLLALAIVTKPTILLLIVFLLWKREFKLIATTVSAFVGLLLAPFLWLGTGPLRHLVTVWQAVNALYVARLQNIGPLGVLERLFTVNPIVRPLVVAPWLATGLWLVVVAVVVMLTGALTTPQPLRRDNQSLLEISLALSAILLIGPLTEQYHLNLLLWAPLSLWLLLRQVDWRAPRWRPVVLGLLAVWVLLCVVRASPYFEPQLRTGSITADLYMLVSLPFFYVLIGLFALQLYAICLLSGRPLGAAVREFLVDGPVLVIEWARDAGRALRTFLGGCEASVRRLQVRD